MKQCKYCSMLIDPQIASAAVELQEKINNACNDASTMRNLAGAMWIGFFVSLIPFLGCIGLVIGLMVLGLFILFPISLVIWQVRYGSIRTSDVDFKTAYRNWIIALVLWVLMLIVGPILWIFSAGLIAAISR
jgi:hypothetical protein